MEIAATNILGATRERTKTTGAFFEQDAPVLWILGAFLFLGLPLCLVGALRPDFLERTHLGSLYFVLVGNTHFLLTFALYLQTANWRYFTSRRSRIFVYLVIPVAIFAFFDVYRALRIAALYPVFDRAFVSAVRLFNFYHFGRQSFGVLQLFKRRAGASSTAAGRRTENTLFYGLVGLMMLTFWNEGAFHWQGLATRALTAFCLAAFGYVLIGLQRQGADWRAAFYLTFQTIAAGFTIYRTYLYPYSLAIHYVEYHVLMYARCFHSPLGEGRLDRMWAVARSSKLFFYVSLLLGTTVVSAFLATAGRQWTPGTALALSLFDGLFVFHFFVESFVWRFSEPHYRQTVLPLFFTPPARRVEGA